MGRRYIRLLKVSPFDSAQGKRVPKVSKARRVEWVEDKKIEKRVKELGSTGKLDHINPARVFCFRSRGAKTRAYARIWGLSRIFQQALKIEPAYIIEVISEKFDKLPCDKQDMVLIHELLHIPKTFSGALVPHHNRGGVSEDRVREIYRSIKYRV